MFGGFKRFLLNQYLVISTKISKYILNFLFLTGCECVLPRDFIGPKNCRNGNLEPGLGRLGEGDGCEAGSLGNNINPGRGERSALQCWWTEAMPVREQESVIQSK